uniref:Putative Polycomb group protein ASXL3 n=1 Tax=Phallusia mammillata TaxID=59560 RepID=A0A6F9D6F7_9ASCI|nr:putative Polycomb group protein ASXL3 [Phallusia mammillata]
MKSSRLMRKRKRKDRTWAEAATLAIQLSSTKVLGIRPILRTIFDRKLKEISLNKAAENVLTTMLNHHAQLPNCPFFRVKGRCGLYALKESWLKKNSGIAPDLSDFTDQEGYDEEDDPSPLGESDQDLVEEEKAPLGSMELLARENHTFSIHGRAMPPEPLPRKLSKVNPNYETDNKNMNSLQDEGANIGSSRQHSISLLNERQCEPSSSPQHKPPERVIMWNKHDALESYKKEQSSQLLTNLDLETPNSILVNANMKALVNRETFSMLPPSYQFKLTTLLPECDRTVDPSLESDKQVLKPSATALTNEFFSQSLQEWRDRLGDGEFTRETQSRIAQEIAKERSKIDTWKEKFFEEFYGQKQVAVKRLRSRGSEASHLMRDFGIEAQLAKFADLRQELQNSMTKENHNKVQSHGDVKPVPQRIKGTQHINNLRLKSITTAKPRNTYAERIAKTKLANSRRNKLRNKISPTKVPFANSGQHGKLTGHYSSPSSIVMKPSGALSVLARCANQSNGLALRNSNNNCDDGKYKDSKYLDIRKNQQNYSAAIFDHSYTSTLWHESIEKRLSSETSSGSGRHPTSSKPTLVLCPRGNLVSSTMAIMKSETRTVKDEENVPVSQINPIAGFSKKDATFKIIKPSATSRSTGNSSDTERVLSICARPLTPESFVTGSSKSTNSFLSAIRQVPRPLVAETITATSNAMQTSTVTPASPQTITTSHVGSLDQGAFTVIRNQVAGLPQTKTSRTFSNTTQMASSAKTMVAYKGSNLPSSVKQNQQHVVSRRHTTPQVPGSVNVKEEQHASQQAYFPNLSTMPTVEATIVRSSVNTLPHQSIPLSTSPLAPGRLSIAGNKRSQSAIQGTPSPPGAAVKWGATSSPSPPMKKTRTLAEIKAQMKAKKAANAAASTRPSTVGLPQPGGVVANSHSHMFCATTFPVYFPLVTSSPSSMVVPPSTSQSLPTTASYIRLPTTATLPLERLQWVSNSSVLSTTTKTESSNTVEPTTMQSTSTTLGQPMKDSQINTNETVKTTAPSNNKGRGKITLKIKAAGSAISLKVDADVIKKELKRKSPTLVTSEDDHRQGSDESSSNDSISDDSEDELQFRTHKNTGFSTTRRSSSMRHSSGSESDCCHLQQRWLIGQASDGAGIFPSKQSCDNNPISVGPNTTSSTLLLKQQRSSAVFGQSPYNVSIKPPSTTCDASSSTTFPGNSLFQSKPSSLSFRPVPVCGSWSANMSASTAITSSTKPVNSSASNYPKPSKYKSTSKGKSMKHMQELARSNMIHSDDSADDGDSSDDDDDEPGDVSTTTASENDKYTESDDSSRSWLPGHPDSPESSLSEDNTATKRQTHFTLKKEVKTRRGKTSASKVLSMATQK